MSWLHENDSSYNIQDNRNSVEHCRSTSGIQDLRQRANTINARHRDAMLNPVDLNHVLASELNVQQTL